MLEETITYLRAESDCFGRNIHNTRTNHVCMKHYSGHSGSNAKWATDYDFLKF